MNPHLALTDPANWIGVLLPILEAAITLVVGWIIALFVQRFIRAWLPRAGGTAITLAPLAAQAVRYAILIVALITALSFLGIPTASILTVVGAASLALA